MGDHLGQGINGRMERRYVFLQGPHGPFFSQLASRLSRLGADVTRVGFTAGDRFFWPRALPYRAFLGRLSDWPETIARILDETRATDIVLYGDTRAIHAAAIKAATARNLRLHIFEEGYLRPYWITYERSGANGNSRLMTISDDEVAAAIGPAPPALRTPPAKWGAIRAHIVYGALYQFFVLAFNRTYRALVPHRDIPVAREAWLYFKLLLFMVPHWIERVLATRAVVRGGFAYHLALLQLAHDANFRDHGPFADMGAFLTEVITGFARGAPAHHHLVFKAHPLEDGRYPLRREIRRLARQHGLSGRVHFVRGGKLARLLDGASTAVTVNSTAAHQALWRGLPVKAFGRAIYTKRGFTSAQPLAKFFAHPDPMDQTAYTRFRHYILATSQLPGSYYSTAGRTQLMRRIIDLMHSETDPYDSLKRGKMETDRQLFAIPNTGC